MEQRRLGPTGVRVSELCLGTMTFGNEADEATSTAIVDRFLEAGGNFVDTANVYSAGLSEEITGRALGKRRDDVILATKVRFPMGDGPNDVGVSPAASASRSRHRCGGSARSGSTSIRSTAGTPGRRSRRRSRRSTTSCTRARSATSAPATSRAGTSPRPSASRRSHNWEPFVCLQPEYSLITRDIERELLPSASSEGLAVLPVEPARRRGPDREVPQGRDFPAGTRGGETENPITFTYRLDDRAWNIVDAVGKLAAETGKTPAQVALNWVAYRPGVTAPIIGARNLTQLEDNLGAVGWKLEKPQPHARVGERFRLGYPHEFIQFADH